MRRMYSLEQLKNIADQRVQALVEGGTLSNAKPIYWHTIYFQRGGTAETSTFGRIFGTMIILNNNPTPLTLTAFLDMLKISGFVGIVFNGEHDSTGASNLENMANNIQYLTQNDNYSFRCVYRNKTTNVESHENLSISDGAFSRFEDLGVNKIN